MVGDSVATQKTTNCPLTSAAGAQASLMRKRQRRRESERVMSSPLMMHMLQVPLSRGDSVITSPAAQGATMAINSTLGTEGSKLRVPLSYEAVM
jgi:hypothetical protein